MISHVSNKDYGMENFCDFLWDAITHPCPELNSGNYIPLLCRRWWHRELSIREFCGATADGVVYRLDDPCFQCSFNMIFTRDFTVICASLKCIWYFSLNTCFTMLGLVLYRIAIVSFSFLLKVADRRLDGFAVAHNDNLRCHWWWQASRSFLHGAQNRVFKCFIYVLNPNNLHIYFKLLQVTYLFI